MVGLSYRTAPLALLERAALTDEASRQLELRACRRDHVAEAVALSTCNRLEVYTEVSKFHNGVSEVGESLAEATGVPLEQLTDHLYVHYEAAAVAHLFGVVCGLDSMAVGEPQILGQVRHTMREATEAGTAGRSLSSVLRHALRVGKRAHAETGLDHAGPSLVEAGLHRAEDVVGPLRRASVLVVGAGAMSGLAVATAARAEAGDIVVTNRTATRADRLAAGVGGRSVPFSKLIEALTDADVVVSCTGAMGHVVTSADVELAVTRRAGRPQVYLDLALPRDVEPGVADLPGVDLLDLEALGDHLAAEKVATDLAQVRELVVEEVDAFLARLRAEAVAPTVVALRAMARSVVESELARLRGRLGDVDDRVRSEIEHTVNRVVDKLLHTPTVRVKELAGEPGGDTYAEALRNLFGLDPSNVAAINAAPSGVPGPGDAA
ncbi:MAG: glutamyl-tRNA reductase [Actinomycetota bacterium]|nr:glutamyl-tRNA reductase [Actinomycetota bacterium]